MASSKCRTARDVNARQWRAEPGDYDVLVGRSLATSFVDLFGNGGPSDETADEMIRAIREWRDTPSNRSLD